MGSIKTYERAFDSAERMLRLAEECMDECGSNLGKASVQHHMGILRLGPITRTKCEMAFWSSG